MERHNQRFMGPSRFQLLWASHHVDAAPARNPVPIITQVPALVLVPAQVQVQVPILVITWLNLTVSMKNIIHMEAQEVHHTHLALVLVLPSLVPVQGQAQAIPSTVVTHTQVLAQTCVLTLAWAQIKLKLKFRLELKIGC